jgi:hypothetical protein
MDFYDIWFEDIDFVILSQDKEEWRDFVNLTVENSVSETARRFLTG